MTTASINRAHAAELLTFCTTHGLDEFFLAKDQGAYFGATNGSDTDDTFVNSIHYVKDCDPKRDDDWYHNAKFIYGGDDFGIQLPVRWLQLFATHPALARKRSFSVKLSAGSVKLVTK